MYFKSFIPYVVITIIIESSILVINNVKVVKGINNTIIVRLPINAPRVILFMLVRLFKI